MVNKIMFRALISAPSHVVSFKFSLNVREMKSDEKEIKNHNSKFYNKTLNIFYQIY